MVKNQLTHYELSMREWSRIKRMANDIEEGTDEGFKFGLTRAAILAASFQ
jgi:hypothetical protein